MICFQKIKLTYILIPLFFIIIVSCDKKTNDEPPKAVQEVITMKITPMEKQSVQAESRSNSIAATPEESLSQSSPHVESIQGTSQKIDTSQESETIESTPVVAGIVQPSQSQNLPQSEVEFNIKKPPVSSDTIISKPLASRTEGAQSEREAINKDTTKSTTNSIPTTKEDNEEDSIKPQSPEKLTALEQNKALLPAGDILQLHEEKLFYILKGKIDPFEPLLKEKTPVVETQQKAEDDIPERILTPLEKLDFSQIKLVAILNRESGSVAMVQESTGKGYIVSIGTYIGRNSGQIVSIEKDKLVIKENVKDYKGNLIDRFQELKLNKLDDKG